MTNILKLVIVTWGIFIGSSILISMDKEPWSFLKGIRLFNYGLGISSTIVFLFMLVDKFGPVWFA